MLGGSSCLRQEDIIGELARMKYRVTAKRGTVARFRRIFSARVRELRLKKERSYGKIDARREQLEEIGKFRRVRWRKCGEKRKGREKAEIPLNGGIAVESRSAHTCRAIVPVIARYQRAAPLTVQRNECAEASVPSISDVRRRDRERMQHHFPP